MKEYSLCPKTEKGYSFSKERKANTKNNPNMSSTLLLQVRSYEDALRGLRDGIENLKVVCSFRENSEAFMLFVAELGENNTCRVLELEWNWIDDIGADAIGMALNTNIALEELNLNKNLFGSFGVESILKALHQNKKCVLKTLKLGNNSIGPNGANSFAKLLEKARTLICIELGGNTFGEEWGRAIGNVLNNTKLEVLGMGGTGIADGVVEICEALKDNVTVNKLGLRGNGISDEGAIAIADVLKSKTCALTELYLNGNQIGTVGGVAIAKAIEKNDVLEILSLTGNPLGDAAIDALKRAYNLQPFLDLDIFKESDSPSRWLIEWAASEKTRWDRCKLLVIGEARCGKTQTINSLLRRDFDQESESTFGEATTLVETSADEEFSEFEEHESPRDEKMFQDVVRRVLKTKQRDARPTKASKATLKRAIRYADVVQTPKKRKSILYGEVNYSRRVSFTIWDFAGQNVFKAMHHMFLSSEAVYLLVFDMAKLLRRETQNKSKSELSFWIKSIALFSEAPRICIVGTHLDECAEDETWSIRTVHNMLSIEILTENILHNLAVYERNGELYTFFPVDNGKVARTENVFHFLRKKLKSKANELSLLNRNDIPTSWIFFVEEMMLRRYRKECGATIPLAHLMKIMLEFGIVEKDASELLSICHNSGIMLHWGTVALLKDTVVLEPQWIVDAVSVILHEPRHHKSKMFKQEQLIRYGREDDRMHLAGIIQHNLLEKVLWSDEKYSGEIEFLLTLLKTTLLICELPHNLDENVCYLVPTLLQNLSPSKIQELTNDIKKTWMTTLKILNNPSYNVLIGRLDFSKSWLPPGLFERLACLCMKEAYGSKATISPREFSYNTSKELDILPVHISCYQENIIEIKVVSGKSYALDVVETVGMNIQNILDGATAYKDSIHYDTLLIGDHASFLVEEAKLRFNLNELTDIHGNLRKIKELEPWLTELKNKVPLSKPNEGRMYTGTPLIFNGTLIINGDFVHGDKLVGDKVLGNKFRAD